jgi:hypothetical protein
MLYKDRLGKVLGAIGRPQPPPAPVAGFLAMLPPRDGNRERSACMEGFSLPPHPPRVRRDWPVAIPPATGANREPKAHCPPAPPRLGGLTRFAVAPMPSLITLHAPAFAVALAGDMERLCELAALAATEPAEAVATETAQPSNPAAQPAASLQPAAAPLQVPPFAIAVREDLERLREVAAMRSSELAGAAPSLPAVPAARMVVAASQLQAATAARATLPAFPLAVREDLERLREVAALRSSELAGAAPSLPAVPAARLVVAASQLQAATAARATLPAFSLAVREDLERLREVAALRSTDLAGAATSLPAVPAARMVAAASQLQTAPIGAMPSLPRFDVPVYAPLDRLREVAALRSSELAGAAASLPAVPAARMVLAGCALHAAPAAAPAILPSFQGLLPVSALANRPPAAAWLRMGERQELPDSARQARSGTAVLSFRPAERLPRFDVTACFDPLAAPVETAPRPPSSDVWMAAPPPVLAARMVFPRMAEAVTLGATPAMPSAMVSAGGRLELPASARWQEAPRPEAVLVDAVPSLATNPALCGDVRLPALPPWQASDSMGGAHAGPADAPAPEPVETWPAVEACTPVPTLISPRLSLPALTLQPVLGSARLDCSTEPDMAPRPALPAPAAAQVAVPMIGRTAPRPRVHKGTLDFEVLAETPAASLRVAGFAGIDFHCRPTPGAVSKRVHWLLPAVPLAYPPLAVRPVFDRWEDLAPPAPETSPTFDKVVSIRRNVVQFATSKRTRHTVGSIAAGLFLGAALWFGTGSVRSGRNARNDTPDVAVNEAPAGAAAPLRRASTGVVSRVRQAIANRAAASWSDSFRGGMEAWGASAKSWAPGWSRSADGYVQPGTLAIFHPTVNYSDYTLEFFGQIEHKSMDWVVRARDSRNYYAMKFKVVEPGLRPIVAMVHYAVVDGKRGLTRETPLVNVMVHNSRPMQVQVDVRGNHFTASVDGQEVESWTDAAPSTGGVGFFAEAGERARLYWMRVSRNEDLLGRICAYVSGSSRQSAELWPGNPDSRPHRGGQDRPDEPAETFGLAAMITLRRTRKSRTDFVERRIETWKS